MKCVNRGVSFQMQLARASPTGSSKAGKLAEDVSDLSLTNILASFLWYSAFEYSFRLLRYRPVVVK